MHVNNLAFKKWGFGLVVLTIAASFLVVAAKAAETSDAIAVRVMPNPNHYSIETWYQQQGYKGAPQKLIVDGYEAVRDGRTVFINAANVDNNKIYTNIYLISYNQDPNIKTVDILGQLVSHWKFNNNLSSTGQCSISKIFCSKDTECPTDYFCSTGTATDNFGANALNKGKCLPKISKMCLVDGDCPVNLFCDSAKAKVTRDTKRLGQLGDLKAALSVIGQRDSRYPELAGGTYIAGNTISTWPSWQETLWPKLSGLNLITDPINVLGNCTGYEAVTCWNKDSKQFYQTVNGKINLPAGSYAYLYSTGPNGISYNVCATFETEGLFDTAEGQLTKNVCLTGLGHTNTSSNTAPRLISSFLAGESGLAFNGYVQAVDDQNDAISWKIDTSYTNFSTWSANPTLRDSGDANQKKIYATTSGTPNNYPITLILTDSRGLEARYPLIIKLTANKPIIEAEDVDYLVNPVLPLNYTFFAQSFSGLIPTKITMTKRDSGSLNLFGFAGATEKKTEISSNRFRVDKSVLIPAGTALATDKTVTYRITATDEKNNVAQKDININLKAEKPYLNFDCDTNARIGQPYPASGIPCLIGGPKDGNHSLSYRLSGPSGLTLSVGLEGKTYLSGTPVTTITASGTPVTITAINEYGVTTDKTFSLKVNSYCGDGLVQTPNSEGRGGVYNDGLESCDGMSGIFLNVASSSVSRQYGCATKGVSSYPILDNSSCIFAAGDKGGGYCGDNICQYKINGILLENVCSCPVDCSPDDIAPAECFVVPPVPAECGNGKVETGEECDGTNLNNKTCQSFNANYNATGLSCGANCKFVQTGCSAKSCWRNSDCSNGYVCKTAGLDTANYYYCTGTQYPHSCNTTPFTTTTLKNQCAASYLGLGGTYFSDAVVATSTKYTECKTACESARYENNNQDLCDWVVSNGRCMSPTPVIACTSFTYSDWKPCASGIRYRDVLTQLPAGCSGGNPETWEACNNCGNGIIDGTEVCDTTQFGTNTCQNRTAKYWSGSLTCTDGCSVISEASCSGFCGDGNCQMSYENNTNCAVDCLPAACVAKTCADLGATCGSWSNGCGSTINCGGCDDGDACTDDTCNAVTFKCDNVKNYEKNVACKVCGDSKCSTALGETYSECPGDCPAPKCEANYYYNGTSCVACGNGKMSLPGALSVNQCVDCFADTDCDTGYYCQGVNSSFDSCNSAANGSCQKKCWNLLETDSITTFLEGDSIYNNYSSGCSVTTKDNPECIEPSTCPTNCNSGGKPKLIGSAASGNSCYVQRWLSKSWYTRRKYSCYHTQYAKYYYNSACPLSQGSTYKGGTVDANGNCVYVSYCGDGNCDADEDYGTCSSDCINTYGYCGDGYCDSGEDYYNCLSDCSAMY
jgi:hypothetical protein